jgi:hypothetical protein
MPLKVTPPKLVIQLRREIPPKLVTQLKRETPPKLVTQLKRMPLATRQKATLLAGTPVRKMPRLRMPLATPLETGKRTPSDIGGGSISGSCLGFYVGVHIRDWL